MGDPLGHNYELLEPIGSGAFGRVWRARTRNGEIVAAKLLRSEYATDASVRARFVREHTVLSAIRHSHIVGVRDLVIEGDVLALVLEYVDGPSLRRVLAEQGTLTPAEAARLVAEACDGLAALHAAKILHRDVKPDNVLLQRGSDGLWHAKLGDFGLARLLGSTLTRTGAFTGTFEYAAPELAGGEPPTLAVDLYSTGIMLYELLCGVTPFRAEHPVTVVLRHQSDPPPRPAGVSDLLWGLIGWLLAKQPTQRPPDAAVVRDTLTALAPSFAGLPAAAPLTEPPPVSLVTAATAAPHEPPWLTEPPTVIGPVQTDRAAAHRSTPAVRDEEYSRREPARQRVARREMALRRDAEQAEADPGQKITGGRASLRQLAQAHNWSVRPVLSRYRPAQAEPGTHRPWFRRPVIMIPVTLLVGLFLIGLLVPAEKPGTAPSPVTGTVRSAMTGARLRATVDMPPGQADVATAPDGTFSTSGLGSGDRVVIRARGYRDQQVQVGDTSTITANLTPLPRNAYAQLKQWAARRQYERIVAWMLRPATGYVFLEASPKDAAIVRENVSRMGYLYGTAHSVAGYNFAAAGYNFSVDIYIVKSGGGHEAQAGWMDAPRPIKLAGQTVLTGRHWDAHSVQDVLWWHDPVLVVMGPAPNVAVQDARAIMTGIIKAQS